MGDDVDMTHHLSAALQFVPAHAEVIKHRLGFGPTMKKGIT